MLLKNTHSGVKMTYSQILNLTSTMTEEELVKLNADLVSIIKHRRKMASKDMGSMLSVGDDVKVTDRNGTSRGKVEKIMRTRAVVNIHGMRYKVPMSMISFA